MGSAKAKKQEHPLPHPAPKAPAKTPKRIEPLVEEDLVDEVIGPINLPLGRLFVEEIITECRNHGALRVDTGQMVFHDVNFVEATPRYGKTGKLKVSIDLTDFSVYYPQGAAEAAIANLKEGVVTRGVLTRHWTDWVDYWAVDFDYISRKEIIIFGNDTMTLALVSVGQGWPGIMVRPTPAQRRRMMPNVSCKQKKILYIMPALSWVMAPNALTHPGGATC